MKKSKGLAWFLICVLCLSSLGNDIGYMPNIHAAERTQDDTTDNTEDSEYGTDDDTADVSGNTADVSDNTVDVSDNTTGDSNDDADNTTDNGNDDADDTTDDGEEDSDEDAVSDKITQLSAVYNAATDKITLSYTKICCDYVDIRISDNDETKNIVEKYNQNTYEYQVTEFGTEYTFIIVPYSEGDNPAPVEEEAVKISCTVPCKRSTIQTMDVTYDMEEYDLLIEWTGSDISSVDIYQDNVKIATVTDSDEYEKSVVLKELTTYQYKIVTFNAAKEEGDSRTFDLKVERFPATICDADAEYNPDTKQIELSWDSDFTSSVDILLNDVEIITGWKGSEYNISYQVQPGAQYVIALIPYNLSGVEGETTEITFSDGDFEIPDAPELEIQSTPVLDAKKNNTGFYRPAIDVIMDVQPGAVYEIYRATTDKKSAYNWIATVTAGEEDTYTFRDSIVGVKTYYYKVLRKIAEDDYIESETLTGLSESSEIEVDIPKAELSGKLLEDGNIELRLNTDCDYISGYDIYRKAGKEKYEQIATIADNAYRDANVSYDTKYYYKVKAYYYDTKTGKKTYGPYSSVFAIRNTIGELTVDVTPLNGNKVEISWNKAGNATMYEVYYKTDTPGDSYELLSSTKKCSVKKTLKSNTTYNFVVKAYRENSEGKNYFSEAAITYKTGFGKPQGLAVTRTSHRVNQNMLIQYTTLKWKRVYKAGGYYVEAYNKETGEYKTIKKIRGAGKTSCVVTDVVPSDSVYADDTSSAVKYRVVAFKGNKKLASEPIDVVLKLASPATKKIKVKGSAVTVSWKQVATAEKYRVYRTCGRGMQLMGETTGLSIVDSTTEVGVTYTYYIQAVNQTLGCTGEYSEPVNCTRNPAAVKKLKATNKGGSKVVLTWNKVKNVDSYIIYYATQKDGSYEKLATVKAGRNQYIHTDLTKGEKYYYKIVTEVKTSSGVSAESKAKKASVTISR